MAEMQTAYGKVEAVSLRHRGVKVGEAWYRFMPNTCGIADIAMLKRGEDVRVDFRARKQEGRTVNCIERLVRAVGVIGGGVKKYEAMGRVCRAEDTRFKVQNREEWLYYAEGGQREESFEVPRVLDFVEYRYWREGVVREEDKGSEKDLGTGKIRVCAINIIRKEEPKPGELEFDKATPPRRSVSWSRDRERRLLGLLQVAATSYSGKGLTPSELVRDAIVLEIELIRALKKWTK